MSLKLYRDEIDKIDNEIITLFEKRMDIVKKVAEYKLKNNIEILNNKREIEILKKIKDKTSEKYEDYIQQLFINIMDISKQYQNEIIKK